MQGTVVLIFQPAEERGGGAKDMINEGVLDGVEAIFGLHLVHKYSVGVVASRPGQFLAGCGSFKAKIKGKGGDAANPQLSIDPILAASAVIVSLQNIVSREIDPLDSQVLSFFQMNINAKGLNGFDSIQFNSAFCNSFCGSDHTNKTCLFLFILKVS